MQQADSFNVGSSGGMAESLLAAREQLAAAMCKARTRAERNKYAALVVQINKLIFA